MNKPDTLGDALPREIARVRDELLPVYDSLPGGAGAIGAMLMRQALDRASAAMITGDIVAMIQSHEELRGFEL